MSTRQRTRLRGLALVTAILSSACAFYPKKSDDFERPSCQVYRNPLTLDVAFFEKLNCEKTEFGACLLGYTAVGPVTALASGSAVLAGNGLYWLGNRSHCSIQAYAKRRSKKD